MMTESVCREMCLPDAVNFQRIDVQNQSPLIFAHRYTYVCDPPYTPICNVCSCREFPVVLSWRLMETQAVVLAGGRGRKLYPFTEDTPKALLPVANRPLLYYPLLYLQNEGFAGA